MNSSLTRNLPGELAAGRYGEGLITLHGAVIPWHVFAEALAKQHPATSAKWLERWYFADGGVWFPANGTTDECLSKMTEDEHHGKTMVEIADSRPADRWDAVEWSGNSMVFELAARK